MTTTHRHSILWQTPSITLPDEHRIFRATDYARGAMPKQFFPRNDDRGYWAVADNSGVMPDETDDGILWLDFATSIKISTGSPQIPIISPEGKRSTFVTNAAGLFVLSDKFRWTVNVNGTLYRAVRW